MTALSNFLSRGWRLTRLSVSLREGDRLILRAIAHNLQHRGLPGSPIATAAPLPSFIPLFQRRTENPGVCPCNPIPYRLSARPH